MKTLQKREELKRDQGTVRHPENPNYKFLITTHEALDIHVNLFDQSSVEYDRTCKRGTFEIKFDQRLYEPPNQVVNLEKRLLAEEALRDAKKK